jgi:hypothetical protein
MTVDQLASDEPTLAGPAGGRVLDHVHHAEVHDPDESWDDDAANDVATDDENDAPVTVRDPAPWGDAGAV